MFMENPRLTIGIPTLDRPEFLRTVFLSLVPQMMHAHIVVGDQGGVSGTREVIEEFSDRLSIEHRKTGAVNLWDNWVKTAANCQTPYFSWVQDDDVLSPAYVKRIVNGLDNHKECSVWLSRLMMSYNTEGFSCWWEGNGPPIPLDFLNFGVSEVLGDMLLALAPCTSPALSPAIAFRVENGFDDMLQSLPVDCDLFHERMHIAEWAFGKHVLCDPWTVGYWVMHETNISKVLNRNTRLKKRQLKVFMEWLEPRMDKFDWEDVLVSWSRLVSPGTIATILATLKKYKPYPVAIRAMDIFERCRPDLKPRRKNRFPAMA